MAMGVFEKVARLLDGNLTDNQEILCNIVLETCVLLRIRMRQWRANDTNRSATFPNCGFMGYAVDPSGEPGNNGEIIFH